MKEKPTWDWWLVTGLFVWLIWFGHERDRHSTMTIFTILSTMRFVEFTDWVNPKIMARTERRRREAREGQGR